MFPSLDFHFRWIRVLSEGFFALSSLGNLEAIWTFWKNGLFLGCFLTNLLFFLCLKISALIFEHLLSYACFHFEQSLLNNFDLKIMIFPSFTT